VAQIERVERAAGGRAGAPAGDVRRRGHGPGRGESATDRHLVDLPAEDDGLEVPEFIPPG
jgi:hypothetical protein